jgi:autotransporter-associated beta strand protein
VTDNIDTINLNSGYSLIVVNANSSTAGTAMNVTTLERSTGASVYMRSSTWADRSRFTFVNSAEHLVGAGGAPGTTTMSIIPWMTAGASVATPAGFATYTPTGIRLLLDTTEYSASIDAGADHNVNTGALTLTNDATINSLRFNTASPSNIGAGRTLTVASGGIFFANNNGAVGIAGDPEAGTLAFGAAEGVLWANNANINTVAASITGTGGITKAGTGTLVLAGDNTYEGLTYVSGGTLQVGNGTNPSRLGLLSDVAVANGAVLSLLNDNAIDDEATLTLESFGLFNGRLLIAAGLNEGVGALFFDGVFADPGTYGATGSGAAVINDKYFGGTGILTVIPEPGSAALLVSAFGLGALTRRSRKEIRTTAG